MKKVIVDKVRQLGFWSGPVDFGPKNSLIGSHLNYAWSRWSRAHLEYLYDLGFKSNTESAGSADIMFGAAIRERVEFNPGGCVL